MTLKSNVGSADRAIRLIVSIVLITLFYTGILPGIFGVLGLILALFFTVTSLISFCPFYKMLKLNSVFAKDAKNQHDIKS